MSGKWRPSCLGLNVDMDELDKNLKVCNMEIRIRKQYIMPMS